MDKNGILTLGIHSCNTWEQDRQHKLNIYCNEQCINIDILLENLRSSNFIIEDL